MSRILLRNAKLVNRNEIKNCDILVNGERIERIDSQINTHAEEELDCKGKHVIPGIIDDQVHFREPGLTHKANIASESAAAAAGGVTSFMEMPNTKPPALTQELLQNKYDIARETSTVNYSFYMGASNDNVEEVLKTDKSKVCGVKIFMGSSTGNMLVDDITTLNTLFSKIDSLIAVHCEDEQSIRRNTEKAIEKYGEDIPISLHPQIRNAEVCYLSSSLAVKLAKKYNTRLHILHISTEDEISLFRNDIPMEEKRITSEVCVHHLYFDESRYKDLGTGIKCNPAIKSVRDRKALLRALKDGYFDVIATDHAPHTMEEKSGKYLDAPSGLPLIQHSLPMALSFFHSGDLELPFIIEKMCHSPARMFDISERGYLDEGKYADLAIIDLDEEWEVNKNNILYKCGWSPLENTKLKGRVISTLCNGTWVYKDRALTGQKSAQRLRFDRKPN